METRTSTFFEAQKCELCGSDNIVDRRSLYFSCQKCGKSQPVNNHITFSEEELHEQILSDLKEQLDDGRYYTIGSEITMDGFEAKLSTYGQNITSFKETLEDECRLMMSKTGILTNINVRASDSVIYCDAYLIAGKDAPRRKGPKSDWVKKEERKTIATGTALFLMILFFLWALNTITSGNDAGLGLLMFFLLPVLVVAILFFAVLFKVSLSDYKDAKKFR